MPSAPNDFQIQRITPDDGPQAQACRGLQLVLHREERNSICLHFLDDEGVSHSPLPLKTGATSG